MVSFKLVYQCQMLNSIDLEFRTNIGLFCSICFVFQRKNEMMDQPKSKDKHQAEENPEPYVTKHGRKVKKTNVLNM